MYGFRKIGYESCLTRRGRIMHLYAPIAAFVQCYPGPLARTNTSTLGRIWNARMEGSCVCASISFTRCIIREYMITLEGKGWRSFVLFVVTPIPLPSRRSLETRWAFLFHAELIQGPCKPPFFLFFLFCPFLLPVLHPVVNL